MLAYIKNSFEIPEADSELVQDMKKKELKFGRELEVVLDENGNETDQYKEVGGNKLFNRVSRFIGNFTAKKVDRTKSFAEKKADRVWGNLDPESRMVTEFSIEQNKQEFTDAVQHQVDLTVAKGRIMHYVMEKRVKPHKAEEYQALINEIILEYQDETGRLPFSWEWLEARTVDEDGNVTSDVIASIFDNMGINYFKELTAFEENLRDEILSEVTVSSDELGIAGTVDMLVRHSDDTYSIIDWKTGKSMNKVFRGMDDLLMKYGNQATSEINDSIRNRAKLQIALYAVLLRSQNPDMKFRSLKIGWIPSRYDSLRKDPDMDVDVSAFIPMIEKFLSDPVALEEAGLPIGIRDKLLEKDSGIFNPINYSSNANQDLVSEMVERDRTPQELLTEKIKELKYITGKNLKYEDLEYKDRKRAEELTAQIQALSTDRSVIISDTESYKDINYLTMWIGNYSDINHPMVQSWKKFKDDQFDKVKSVTERKLAKFRSLLRPVLKEYEKEHSKIKVLGNTAYNYDELFGFMYIEEGISDENTQVRERLLTNTEEDEELRARYNNLSKAKQRLLDYTNEEFSSYFNGPLAFLNDTATEVNGRAVSNLELYNYKKKNQDKRTWHKGFFFKVPPTSEDIILRNGNGSEIAGRFSLKTLSSLVHKYGTFFEENYYEGWDDKMQALPIKFLGNDYIDSSRSYTKNMEIIFSKAIYELEYKKHMDAVHSIGKVVETKLKSDEAGEPAYKNISKFMNVKLQQDIQRKIIMVGGKTRKVRIPMYTPTGWQNKEVSIDAILKALTKWASMNTMWLRPFQGVGNGVHAMLLTHRDGLKGSISQLNFTKIDGNSIDFTYSDIARAEALYFGDYVKSAIQGNFRRSKMFLMAKELNFFGDNFDYAEMEKTLLSLRNRYMSESMMYMFHSIPEEFVSLTTMTAQLLHMKNEVTGESLWDSYDVVEIKDEDGKGTGEYELDWNGGVRGYVSRSDGDTQYTEKLTRLDAREKAKMRKVHERLQGGYRKDEASILEAYAIGKMVIHLKKYFPRLLLNAIHIKRRETDLGYYKKMIDEKTGKPILKDEDGKEIPMYEWVHRITEGRFLTLANHFVMIATFGQLNRSYRWSNLEDEQKQNLIEAMLTVTIFLGMYGAYLKWFDDLDDDDTTKKWWKMYMVDNLSQQYNIIDMTKTIKTIATPVAVAKAADFAIHGTNMMIASGAYAVGNDDYALTKKGDLKSYNSFVKTIPYLSSYYDIKNRIGNIKDPESILTTLNINKLR